MVKFQGLFSGTNSLASQQVNERQVGIYESTVSLKTTDKLGFNFDSLIESMIDSLGPFNSDIRSGIQSSYFGELDETPDITMEGVKDIAKSAVEFFKRMLRKFKEYMKKFYMLMYSHLGSFDKFIIKYADVLKDKKPDFHMQGYEFSTRVSFPAILEVETVIQDFNAGLSKISKTSVKEEETKLAQKTSAEESAKIRGAILGVGPIEKGDFTSTARKLLRGGQSEMKEIHVNASYLKKAINDYNEMKTRLKEYQKEEKKITDMINACIRIFSNGPAVELGSSGQRVYSARSVSSADGKVKEDGADSTKYDITESNATLVNKYYTIMYSRLNEFASLVLVAMTEKVKAVRDEMRQAEKVIRKSIMSGEKDKKVAAMEFALITNGDSMVSPINYTNQAPTSVSKGLIDEQDVDSQLDYLSTEKPPAPPAVDESDENVLLNRTRNNFDSPDMDVDKYMVISPMDYGGATAGTFLELQLDRSMESVFDGYQIAQETLSLLTEAQHVLEAGAVRKVAGAAKGGVQKTKDFFKRIYEFIKNILARFKDKVQSLQNNINWVNQRKEQFNNLDYNNITVEVVPYWKGDIFGTVDQFIGAIKINNMLGTSRQKDIGMLSDRQQFVDNVLSKFAPKDGQLVDGLKDLMRVGNVNGADAVKLSGSSLKSIVQKEMIPGVVGYNETVKQLDELQRKVDTELKVIEREMTKREMQLDKPVTESAVSVVNTIFESLAHILPMPLLEAEVNTQTNQSQQGNDQGAKASSNTKENKKVNVTVVDKDKAAQEKSQGEMYSNRDNAELQMMRNVVHFQQLALTTTMTIAEERNVVYNNTLRSIWNELNTVGNKASKAEKKVEKERNRPRQR